MNKHVYRLFTLIALVLTANQALYGQGSGQISGKVRDHRTGEPVQGVTVKLLEHSQRTRTDEQGIFHFGKLPLGDHALEFTSIGYQSRSIKAISISANNPIRNLGDIALKSAENALEEVVVTPTPPLVEFGDDTITYNVGQSVLAEGSAAGDMLKGVPMVDVDIDGNPTIAGMLNTRIFINGKPADFTAETIADLLNVLPADMIAKVEVITNPEARYGSDGDGIINIVLKKDFKLGLTGALSLTGGILDDYNGSAYLARRRDSLAINASYGYRLRSRLSDNSIFRSNYRAGEDVPSSFFDQLSDSRSDLQGHNISASVDWDMTPKQNLNIRSNVNSSEYESLFLLNDQRLNSDGIQRELRSQQSLLGTNSLSYRVNADYTAKLRRRWEQFEAGFVLFNNSRRRNRELSRKIERQNGTPADPYAQYTDNDIDNSRMELTADYRRRIGRRHTFQVGVKGSFATNENDQAVLTYNHRLGIDTINPVLSNRFRYRENIYAAYSSIRLRTKSRWSFRLGVRAEGTQLQLEESIANRNSTRPYINFFPTLSINKVYAKRHRFGASYSLRLRRPREHMLNPLINDSNPANVRFGNPDLRPAFTHRFQLRYSVASERWAFTPRLTYASTGDIIQRYRITPDTATYLNIATRNEWSLNMAGSYKRGSEMNVTWGTLVSRVDYWSPVSRTERRTGFNLRANIGAGFSFPHRISAEFRVTYRDQMLAQGRRRGTATAEFGARKAFFSNKLLVRLTATDPFAHESVTTSVDGLTASGSFYFQESNRLVRSRNYRLGLTYRFLAGNSKK